MAKQRTAKPPTSKAVFVNCAFDDGFRPILRAIVFTVVASGSRPRSAPDATDGAEVRLGKIAAVIGDGDWSIHDLPPVQVEDGRGHASTGRGSWAFASARGCSGKAATAASARRSLRRSLTAMMPPSDIESRADAH